MARYAVWLFAVNVGGNNKVPMAWLRDAATEAGFTGVATYLQSGNLVVTSSAKAAEVEEQVAGLIRDGLGLDVKVTVRSRAELAKIIERNPMPKRVDEPSRLHVSFLDGKPDAKGVKAIDGAAYAPDEFAVAGREIYLWFPNGAGRSKLATLPWRKKIGVAGTARNWRTLLAVLDLLDQKQK
ncbi:MAG TPA: DUF1697 domain-containing protein [Mycobacteriales bacterium]|nr:DUF1697 domain-containing protein [Mycobacteriales bacterium]